MAQAAHPDLTLNESVYIIDDQATGLRGVIAIHSTALGPAAGGCRLWRYDNHADLLTDALRLAQGMSFKNAMAGLPFGGGKAVLMLPHGADRRTAFRAFGAAVERLGGAYVTAEDVGTTVADMESIRNETRHVAGLTALAGRAGGDPSPWTARGVFDAMRLAVERELGGELSSVTVAVQGLGQVGRELCRLLAEAGAKLIVADVDEDRVAQVALLYGAHACAPESIHCAPADVFAPCALGAVLSQSTIPSLAAKLICGAANNQLATAEDGQRLADRGLIYCPDYVVNAGGIINVAAEYLGETHAEVDARIARIPARLEAVLDRADAERRPASLVADQMAAEIISAAPRRLAA